MSNDIALAKGALSDSQPGSKWLPRVRAIWFVLIVIIFITFLYSIPGTYQMLNTVCEESRDQCVSWAQPSPSMVAELSRYHISLESFAIYHIVLYFAVSLVFWGAGLLVFRYRSHDWHGLLVSYLLITVAGGGVSFVFLSGSEFSPMPDILGMVSGFAVLPLYLALSQFFQTFPDGRIYPRWSRIGTLIILMNYAAWLAPGQWSIENWPPVGAALWLLFVFGSHVTIQGYRYRYFYTLEQRQQTKWLIFGFSITLLSATVVSVLSQQFSGVLAEGTVVAFCYYLPIAFAVTIAILRYQLWDIDLIINRTLVYGVLTAILVGVYALIAGALGLLVQDDGNFVVSLLGAGVIAVIFQPLRQTIQRAINRWMFGQRDDPLTIMVELGKSLEAILLPDVALQHLVETTSRTLKLPYAAIERDVNPQLIAYGKSAVEPERFPLSYQGQILGQLLVASRSPSEALNGADRLVLENVARQASNVVFASRLADDLQRSRQQILTTREEERRRLRRDLHDGLGPALATLTLQAEAAREWLKTNPEKSEALLDEIITGSQSTLADIRRIVYALRPPALDDLGLVPAIREQAARFSDSTLSITVDAPEELPQLPAAVEVAAYRITQEAMTNVTRHSQAHNCRVCLSVNGKIEIEVVDDGVGIPVAYRAGVGLSSMYERAAELGGSCVIASEPGEGTQIKVLLPRE